MTILRGELSTSPDDPQRMVFREGGLKSAALELILAPVAPVANPQAPFQRTMPPRLDPVTNEWVWEFRVGRGTGDWV